MSFRLCAALLLTGVISLAVEAAPVSPAVEQSAFLRAIRHFENKDFSSSRALLAKLVQLKPEKALYWFNLGNSCFMMQDFACAERAFGKVEELGSPLAAAARFYRAKSYMERGDSNRARDVLQDLVQKGTLPPGLNESATQDLLSLQINSNSGPDPAGAAALDHYKKGQYKKALRAIRARKTNTEDILVLRALILIKLDREDEAHRILRKVDSNVRDLQLKDLVTSLIEHIRDRYSRPKWLFMEAAGGYDSNMRRLPSAQSGGVLFADIGAGSRLYTEDLWQWNVAYVGRLRDNPGHPDLRVYSNELQTSFGRAVGTDLMMFAIFGTQESWENRPVRLSLGGRMKLRTGTEKYELGGDLQASSDKSVNTDHAYIAGTSTQARAYAGAIHYPVYSQVYLDVERQVTGDQTYSTGALLPTAFTGWGPGARVLWRMEKTWAAELSASFMTRDYKTGAQPGSEKRKDEEMTFGVRFTRIFSPELSGYVSLTQTGNRSTLGPSDTFDMNFKRTIAIAGVVWDAL